MLFFEPVRLLLLYHRLETRLTGSFLFDINRPEIDFTANKADTCNIFTDMTGIHILFIINEHFYEYISFSSDLLRVQSSNNYILLGGRKCPNNLFLHSLPLNNILIYILLSKYLLNYNFYYDYH